MLAQIQPSPVSKHSLDAKYSILARVWGDAKRVNLLRVIMLYGVA